MYHKTIGTRQHLGFCQFQPESGLANDFTGFQIGPVFLNGFQRARIRFTE